ncbi:iron-containing alcohol dehydrogenase [Marinobacter salarius]
MLDRLFLSVPPRIIGGWGSRKELAPLLQRMGHKAALIVTDPFFSQETTLVRELQASLTASGIDSLVFDGGIPDPTVEVCLEAQKEIEKKGWHERIDHVIALGGGSNIDLAKVLSLLVKYGGVPQDYVGEGGNLGQPLPLVAIPTTAGTGSEITPGAILVDSASATKVAVMSNDLRPAIALIDPELTLSCPPNVTADAGLDALTHALESYLTQDSTEFDRGGDPDPVYAGRNELTRMFASESIRLCFAFLGRAYARGTDRPARESMAAASLYAALSYGSAGLNAVHALAYALAGLTHASHGRTNAVYLPYVLDALRDIRRDDLAQVARSIGETATDPDELARRLVIRTRNLVAQCGIPVSLAGFGVKESQLADLIKNGLAVRRLTKAFPIQPAEAVYERIVRNAFAGTLDAERKI